jgi:hypothetical protein
MSEGGDAYILYNDKYRNEYYMIENRQKKGWDSSLPGKGLQITHIDFDQVIWEDNTPNTKVTSQDLYTYGYHKTNDHQRCTIFRASNSTSIYNTSGDLYPYNKNDSLTSTSVPAATLYNKNSAGTKFMQKGITKITQNSDGTMSFVYGNPDATIDPIDPIEPGEDGTLLYETFDQCDGKGGNDGQWKGTIANGTFKPDLQGWESGNEKEPKGANQCAKLGTGSANGILISPVFKCDGKARLTFRAGAWDGTNDGTTLKLSVSGGTISPATVTMTKGAFSNFEATITATGEVRVTFEAEKLRFFLDDVLIKAIKEEILLGDVNGDGKVDVSDYIGVANHILQIPQEDFNEQAADVNGDGKIDVSDYIGIANIILTGSPNGSSNGD